MGIRNRSKESMEKYPPKQCTAMSRQTGQRCKHWCVPGRNVCRYHGGLTPIKIRENGGESGLMHGMYSSYVNTSLKDTYEEFLEHTDTIDSLNSDIALMRAMMAQTLGSEEPRTAEEREFQTSILLRYMRDIRSAISLKDDLESRFTVSIQTLQVFLNQVLYILQDTIDDEDELNRVISRLRNVKLLDPDAPLDPKRLVYESKAINASKKRRSLNA